MTLNAQQLAARSLGLGGSDAAAALGLSPWKTPLELFREKRGEDAGTIAESEPMRWGSLLEPVIRQEYSSRTGRVVRVPETTLVHPAHAFMIANLDGLTDDGRLLEVKTARSAQDWGEPGTDAIPQHYLLQIQHYLIVTALPIADVAVLIGGSEYRQYEIPADAELQEMLVEGELEFWQRVESGEAPDADLTSPRALDIVRKLFPDTNGQRVTADEALEQWRRVYDQACEKRDVYVAAADAAKAHLLYAMGGATELAFADGKALRRRVTKRKSYTVPDTRYIDARLVALKE